MPLEGKKLIEFTPSTKVFKASNYVDRRTMGRMQRVRAAAAAAFYIYSISTYVCLCVCVHEGLNKHALPFRFPA